MMEVNPRRIRLPKMSFRPYDTDIRVLQDSIAAMGMVNPISVFVRGGKFTVRDGALRLKAARNLKLKKVPVQILDGKFIENLLQPRLSDTEYRRRMWIALEVHSLTQIANALGLKISEIKTVLT